MSTYQSGYGFRFTLKPWGFWAKEPRSQICGQANSIGAGQPFYASSHQSIINGGNAGKLAPILTVKLFTRAVRMGSASTPYPSGN
jgi:hypothetical protein